MDQRAAGTPDNRPGAFEIGYLLNADYAGRGIMTSAVRVFSAHVFANFSNVHELYASVADNDITFLFFPNSKLSTFQSILFRSSNYF